MLCLRSVGDAQNVGEGLPCTHLCHQFLWTHCRRGATFPLGLTTQAFLKFPTFTSDSGSEQVGVVDPTHLLHVGTRSRTAAANSVEGGFAHLPAPLVYPRCASRRVRERDHVAHVEGHDVVELDALVGRSGAQALPVLRHLSPRPSSLRVFLQLLPLLSIKLTVLHLLPLANFTTKAGDRIAAENMTSNLCPLPASAIRDPPCNSPLGRGWVPDANGSASRTPPLPASSSRT